MYLKNITRMELIGSYVEIVKASNTRLIGIKGKIIDETKNMVMIETNKGLKKVIKNQAVFRINVENKAVDVDGKKLVNRPEDRLKKIRK